MAGQQLRRAVVAAGTTWPAQARGVRTGMHTAILSLALFAAPATPDAREVWRVETTTFDDSAEVLVYDGSGEVSAVLLLQAEPNGRVRLDVDFADGLYLSAIASEDGFSAVEESADAAEVADRLAEIEAFLYHQPPVGTHGKELWCLGSLAVASTCLTGNAVGCIAGGVGIVCNCMPLWEKGYTPPGCE